MKHNLRREYTSQFFKGNKILYTIVFLVTMLTVSLNLAITWILQQILDAVSGEPGALGLPVLGLLTAGVVLLIVLFKQISYWTEPRFMRRAMLQYKNYAFQKLTKKSISAFRQESVSDYLSRFSNDLNTVEMDYLDSQFKIASYVVEFVGALLLMLYYNPVMAVVAIAFCVLPILAAVIAGNRMEGVEKQVSEKNAGFLATLRDALGGFPVMKSFKAEAEMAKIIRQSSEQVEDAKCHKRKLSTILYMIGAVAGVTAQLGTFLVGGMLKQSGYPITPGELIAFIDLTGLFIESIREMPALLGKRKAALALVDKLANSLQENVPDEGKDIPGKLENAITVSNLNFAYEPEKPVLKQINCKFEAGKSYAIVGASGSGKSTLLNLLMGSGAYEGQISYDDQELRQISSKSLFDFVSMIQQNVFVFNASIRDNITMFKSFPKEQVDQAIVLSGLASLIAEKGEHYICGESGCNLSGGEKQRISIARSLLRNAQVLLADEATASLDAETAYQVSDSILNLRDRTRIVVTHALDAALLRRYDCILTMKSGEIVESGTFEDLMTQKGYFYSLYTVSQ